MLTTFRFICILLFFTNTNLFAQSNEVAIEAIDFNMDLDANQIGKASYQLTPNKKNSTGRIWYPEPINISDDFYIETDIFLGCSDELGADGLVFIFNLDPVLGMVKPTQGLGYPSLGIEIDTYYNPEVKDPNADHVSILDGGSFDHRTSTVQPVVISNIEDCNYHELIINWKAQEKILLVILDKKLIFRHKTDLYNLFNEKEEIYWGVAASTGKGPNTQEVDFKKLAFSKLKEVSSYNNTDSENRNLNYPLETKISDHKTNHTIVVSQNNPKLSQNYPNPFSLSTNIDYIIPLEVKEARIKVYSVDGKTIRTVSIEGRGNGTTTITIAKESYLSGTLYYSLILDGEVHKTKKMLLIY